MVDKEKLSSLLFKFTKVFRPFFISQSFAFRNYSRSNIDSGKRKTNISFFFFGVSRLSAIAFAGCLLKRPDEASQ